MGGAGTGGGWECVVCDLGGVGEQPKSTRKVSALLVYWKEEREVFVKRSIS